VVLLSAARNWVKLRTERASEGCALHALARSALRNFFRLGAESALVPAGDGHATPQIPLFMPGTACVGDKRVAADRPLHL
jgi:hypothetical protein